MNVAELVERLQVVLSRRGFGLRENMGGCAISALYFAEHLSRLKVKHKIIYWSDGDCDNDCAHCQVRIPVGNTFVYLDSQGVTDRDTAECWGCEEVVQTKKNVAWEIANVGWNDDYDRSNNAKLRAKIDKVFEQVRV